MGSVCGMSGVYIELINSLGYGRNEFSLIIMYCRAAIIVFCQNKGTGLDGTRCSPLVPMATQAMCDKSKAPTKILQIIIQLKNRTHSLASSSLTLLCASDLSSENNKKQQQQIKQA